MYSFYLINIITAFIFSILTYYIYPGHIEEPQRLSEWISLIMANGISLLITVLLQIFIFTLLIKPSKYAFQMLIHNKGYRSSWEEWKGLIILLLIFDVYFYLFVNFEFFLLLPLIIFWTFKLTFFTYLPKKTKKKSYYY